MARRLALLVANYRYQDSGLRRLTAPGHDAEALAVVLRHPDIAGFEVTTLMNEPSHVVGRAIGEFYRNRRSDDLTFLYFTGHGVKDDQGRLYLAMTDTRLHNLLFTALSARQIDDAMESCSSRQKVLVLDCCYSGAFPAGRISKADPEVHTLERFRGKGRVVLTASDSTQYSFEGNEIVGEGTRSVFTRFLVEGLTTGKGDLDGDGDISLDELYSYVHDRVVEEMPQQRPKKQENIEGRIVVARNIYWTLPVYLLHAVESPIARDRLAALDGLAKLYRVGNEFVRTAVIDHICYLMDDNSKVVAAAATKLMKTFKPEGAQGETEEQQVTEKRLPAAPNPKPGAGETTQTELQTRSRLATAMNTYERSSAREIARTGLAVSFMLVSCALFAASVFAPDSRLSGWALIRPVLLMTASFLLVTGMNFALAIGVAAGVALWNLQLLGFLTLLGDEASFVTIFAGTLLLMWGLVLACLESSDMTAAVSLRKDRWSALAVITVVIAIAINGTFGEPSYWGGWSNWGIHVGILAALCLAISLRMNLLQHSVTLTAAVFFVVHTIFWRVLSLGDAGIEVWIDVATTVLALGGSYLSQWKHLSGDNTSGVSAAAGNYGVAGSAPP